MTTKTRITKAVLAAELAQARELISQLQADLEHSRAYNRDLAAKLDARDAELLDAAAENNSLAHEVAELRTQPQVPSTPAPSTEPSARKSVLSVMKDYAVKHRVITRLIDGVPSFYESRVGQWLTIPA